MLSSLIASRMDGVSRYAREKGRCARVSADHVSAGRLAAAHLAERNYRFRVFFTLDWDGNVRNRIWRGFTESGPAEKWVFSRECPNVRWDDWNAVGRWLAGKFAAADKPLGVLAYSQGEAVLLMDAALGLGIRVPDELGVIAGNDDPILLESQPVPVTAVDTDLERGAYEAAALLDNLMDRLGGRALQRQLAEIPPRGVVVRRSTAEAVSGDPLVGGALWDRVSETYLRNSGKYSLVGGGAVRGRCVATGCRGVASHPRHPRRR